MSLQCKHCPSLTHSSLDVARMEGRRTFRGKSVTGKDLDDVVCPKCAGTAAEKPPSWRVVCHTCDWEWEDEYDEGPLDQKQAQEVARDHRCEPWVDVLPPPTAHELRLHGVQTLAGVP